MALVLKIDVVAKSACSKLVINELTGLYNSSLNIGGYDPTGVVNPAVSSITSSSIVITRPDAVVVTITNPVGLPTSDTTLEYEISASTINSTWSKVEDGVYTIVYSVTTNAGVVYTYTKYKLIVCNKECCVAKLFAKIATDNDCNCDSITIKNANYADALLQGLISSGACGSITSINNLLTKLNKICTTTSSYDCGCS